MKIGTAISMIAIMAATTVAIAQGPGADTYKTKCQSCHGAAGVPNPGMAKAMGIKPVSDPAVKGLTEAKMIATTTNGSGKMPAFKGKLTDAQIKDSVTYFRSLAK
jgi:mono/diheme cytochrome c family protein